MIGQKTREINPIGPEGSQEYQFGFHEWSESGYHQYDPTTASTFSGDFGDYEDWLFIDYRKCTSVYPSYTFAWGNGNETGQSIGCEAVGHRL